MKHAYTMLGAVAALGMSASTALADGAPRRAAAAAAPAPFSWSGAYIGGNVGATWADSDQAAWTPANAATTAQFAACIANGSCPTRLTPDSHTGVIGGVQIGYNWQMQHVVFGIEVDFQGSTAHTGTQATLPVPGGGAATWDTVYNANLHWLSTVRARLGFLVSPTVLAYVTGGFAFGEVGRSWGTNLLNAAATFPTFGRSHSVDTGWTIGGGLEWAFSNKVTLGAEYLYVNLDGDDFSARGLAGNCTTSNCNFNVRGGDFDTHIARLKVNFKF